MCYHNDMFKTYDEKLKKILSEKPSNTDWKQVLDHHRTMISRIQHERFIHLLVTIFVGLVMSVASFATILTQNPGLLVIAAPLIILFIAYIFHYRFLENTTQAWYKLEDDIVSLCRLSHSTIPF